MGAGPPRWSELGAKSEHGQQPRGGHLIEEEREHLQRRGISPVQVFPGIAHSRPLRFFNDPRHQRFLGLLLLLLRTQRNEGSILRMGERKQSGQQRQGIGLGEAVLS